MKCCKTSLGRLWFLSDNQPGWMAGLIGGRFGDGDPVVSRAMVTEGDGIVKGGTHMQQRREFLSYAIWAFVLAGVLMFVLRAVLVGF